MKKLNSVIMDIQNLRGAELENDINEDEIDTIDLLEDVTEYEVDMIIADVYDYKADNSYNWMSPVSNHFDFKIYDLHNTSDGKLVEMKIHRDGDVRGNYTETFLLEFDDDFTFLETILENSKLVTFEVEEENYDVMVDAFSDVMKVMDEYGTLITETCETEKEYIIEEIKEAVAQ